MFGQLQQHLAEAGAAVKPFKDHYPARTTVATSASLSEGAPLELRAVAVIGSGAKPETRIPQPGKPAH